MSKKHARNRGKQGICEKQRRASTSSCGEDARGEERSAREGRLQISKIPIRFWQYHAEGQSSESYTGRLGPNLVSSFDVISNALTIQCSLLT